MVCMRNKVRGGAGRLLGDTEALPECEAML